MICHIDISARNIIQTRCDAQMVANLQRTKNTALNIPTSTSKRVRRLSYGTRSGEQRADRVDVRSAST